MERERKRQRQEDEGVRRGLHVPSGGRGNVASATAAPPLKLAIEFAKVAGEELPTSYDYKSSCYNNHHGNQRRTKVHRLLLRRQ